MEKPEEKPQKTTKKLKNEYCRVKNAALCMRPIRRNYDFYMILYEHFEFFSFFYFDPGVIWGRFRHRKSILFNRKIDFL